MRGDLFFQASNYETKVVITDIELEEVTKRISEYVTKLNPNFKIYYIRTWEKDDIIWYDVGSHSEFFYFKKN